MSNSDRQRVVRNFLPVASNPRRGKEQFKDFVNNGNLYFSTKESVSYGDGALWESSQLRSVGRKAHGWFFILSWAAAFSELDEEDQSDLIFNFSRLIERWMEKSKDPKSMAFHDETTAQRVMNLCFVLDAFGSSLPRKIRQLTDSIIENDLELLNSESFYAGVNNHGMFQDMAILFAISYGRRSEEAERLEDFALSRLASYFSVSYTADGIHNENNPYYHMAISRHMKSVLDYANIVGKSHAFEGMQSVFEHADKYAAFSLTPGGHFPPISDTIVRQISRIDATRSFGEGWLLGAVTRGDQGKLPREKVFVAESSGYGICRTGWTNDSDTYVFFSSAYNADYHKHADELSLYVYANGYEVISESGTHGYERNHPFTQYAYSSFAHNTLIVDNQGLPRVERTKAHLTTLTDTGSNEDQLDVMGRTQRYAGVDWTRQLSATANSDADEPIVVRDRIVAEDKHNYKILWHFGSEISSTINGSVVELFIRGSDKKIGELAWFGSDVVSVEKFRGVTEPNVQGWKFPRAGEAEEADCLQFEFEGTSVFVEWQISLKDFLMRQPHALLE